MAFMILAVGQVPAAQSWKNETLRYALYIGPIKAGEASFVTRNTTFEGQKVVRMDLIARTTSAAEKIFSMNDTLTTYLEADNVRPVYFRKSCNEGGDVYTETARYTYAQDGLCRAQMRKNYMDGRVKERTESSRTAVYDMVSVMGYARAMNTSGMKEGQHIDFRLVDAAEILDECLIYQGKETVKLSGKKYNCWRRLSYRAKSITAWYSNLWSLTWRRGRTSSATSLPSILPMTMRAKSCRWTSSSRLDRPRQK